MFRLPEKQKKAAAAGWKLPLLLGVLLPFIVWGVYRVLNPPIDPGTDRAAHILGYDPREYDTMVNLMGKAERQGDLSNGDWQKVMTVFHDPNVKIHQEAITVMMLMPHSPRRNQILAMVKPQLNSPDLGVEVRTLTLLWRFKDPEWRAEVLKRRNRPEERMQYCVQSILSHGNGAH